MNIGVIANLYREDVGLVLQRLEVEAEEHHVKLFTCDDTAKLLSSATKLSKTTFPTKIDRMLALGGDGTLLYAARVLNGASVPILGVNLGRLGFMTALRQEELPNALGALISGETTISRRTVLEVELMKKGRKKKHFRALNDAVLSWGSSSGIAHIELDINKRPAATYACDGLIIATPTGSTGHSLSAGGPIVHPETPAFILSVIAPHTLSSRPVVVPDENTFDLRIAERSKQLLLAVDGQAGIPVDVGDKLRIRRAENPVELITLPTYDYFAVLREKLDWRGSNFKKPKH